MTERKAPKYTPGPWRVLRHGYESSYVVHAFIENAEGKPALGIWWPDGNEEQAANATLASAAPEMYEALRWILDTVVTKAVCPFGIAYSRPCGCNYHAAVDAGRTALAKAEGREVAK